MKTISATNLRVQLRDLLADLHTGPVAITKHSRVVAILSAPVAAVEASEAPCPTPNPSEAENASESLSEPVEGEIVEVEDESDDSLDDLDAEFEAYISQDMMLDRPSA
jgi:antitoxin (DNA-binding transcriptional repressor) of toxin-antitoxin stability system